MSKLELGQLARLCRITSLWQLCGDEWKIGATLTKLYVVVVLGDKERSADGSIDTGYEGVVQVITPEGIGWIHKNNLSQLAPQSHLHHLTVTHKVLCNSQ